MRYRRVSLCLSDQPSEEILAVARAVKAALSAQYQVRLRLADEPNDEEDDALTPVDNPAFGSIVVRISEDNTQPPDGGGE